MGELLPGAEAAKSVGTKAGRGYFLFSQAERLNMTVTKLLTGKDLPLTNLEVVLANTYGLAKMRLEKQQGKGKGGRRR